MEKKNNQKPKKDLNLQDGQLLIGEFATESLQNKKISTRKLF